MRIVFSPRSVERLREIQSYIAYDHVTAAAQVVARIRQCVELLAEHPKLGTAWRGGPTRALVVAGLPYRIHYRIRESEGVVEIITVAHTSRRAPRV